MAEPARDEEWLNTPQQARSQETLRRFMEATSELLRNHLFDDITIADIVQRADRTVGSFYARFDDKTALMRTLTGERMRQIRDLSDTMLSPEEWAKRPVAELVHTSMFTITGLFNDYGHIFRAGLALAATDPEARLQRNRHYDHLATRLCAALMGHPDVDPDKQADVERAAEMVGTVLDSRLVFRAPEDERSAREFWDATARDLSELFVRAAGI